MIRNTLLTSLVEFTAFGLFSGAIGLWAVALTPIH
ncbi:hypothetical protein GGR33_001103 [Methylobacterium brachythecii]|jgi:hypothetical protein|uniref:Uncharacterized protein n=1 Tax=Methylobacterium brachythecii TaxID=1176177 RepID=A0A7W6AE41_9HYPH|nr:hypothetical protein [Methylobacterium brachythecii]